MQAQKNQEVLLTWRKGRLLMRKCPIFSNNLILRMKISKKEAKESLICTVMGFFFELAMFPEHPVGITYWNAAMRLGFYAIVSFLLATLEDAHRRKRSLARINRTTTAPNSRHFYEVAEAEVNRSKRYDHPMSVIYLDLDNFKTVNDRIEHNTGDELLCQVVKTINENIRDSDTVARLGGDEFAILLPGTEKKSAKAPIKKVYGNLLAALKKNN